MMDNLMKDIRKVLITREQLQKRVAEMGQEITRDYQGRDVVLVGILKGAMPFLCDLMRCIDLPVTLEPWSFPVTEIIPFLPEASISRRIWTRISGGSMSLSWKTLLIQVLPWIRWYRF